MKVNDSIFESKLYTDNLSGYAKIFDLGKRTNINNLSFRINNSQKIKLDNLNSDFIYIKKDKKQNIYLRYSDKFIGYD